MLARKALPLLSMFLLVIAFGACERKGKGKGIAAPEELAPLSEEEAGLFATRLTQSLNSCDKAELHKLIDIQSMMRRAARLSSAKGQQERQVLEGMRRSSSDLRSQFCGSPSGGSALHFLRVHKRGGKQALLYRTIMEESFNYLEFYAGKSADGQIKIDDVYIYMSGQTLAENLAQMIDIMLNDDSVVDAMENISDKIASNPAGALSALQALPEKAQKAKPMQLLKIQAAAALDDETYAAAIKSYEALFPGDPSLNLVSIDGLILRKSYQKALRAVDNLDNSLGGDPYLDQVRVGLLLDEGKDLDRATELAEKALQADPESEDAHYLLLGVHMANRNFGGAVAIMRLMGERFELVFEEEGLDPSDPNYIALKASPEWEAYKLKTSGP